MNTIPYRQITKLGKYTNCILEKDPVDINSLIFFFDSCNSSVPDEYVINSEGTFVGDYHNTKIILITKDQSQDNKVTKKGTLMKYYLSDYVQNNCKRFMTIGLKDLIGRYVVDWSESDYVKEQIKSSGSKYIELDYYIEHVEE